MGKEFPFAPVEIPPIRTKNRVIKTPIPVPASKPTVEALRVHEPLSMSGQPLVIWDRAVGVHVYDSWGNKWIDFSSGVLVANAGHGNKAVTAAIVKTARKPLHHSYCFPNQERADLVKYIIRNIAPQPLDKVFLLTTGSEACECAIKICRVFGHRNGDRTKDVVISFESCFHGRTMGSQMAGGLPSLKDWIVNHDPNLINVPCPDGFRGPTDFDVFLRALEAQGVAHRSVAGLIMESYQGGSAILLPLDYMQKLRKFLDDNNALLIFDEVQSGIGRTGRMFCCEHYGVRPDMIVCGKGISSGLPLAAVIGHSRFMNLFAPGSMTSTHTGNPIICAAALANLKYIKRHHLVENSAALGPMLNACVNRIRARYPDRVGHAASIGLVGAIQVVSEPGSNMPDHDTAYEIVKYCVEHGLLLLAPVGNGGGTVKLAPPLTMDRDTLEEALSVLEDAFKAVCGKAAPVAAKRGEER